MTIRSIFLAAAIAAVPTLAQAHSHAQHHDAAPAGQSESSRAYMAAHATMMKAMGIEPTGDADKDFTAMMIPHHQGAIDMARVQLAYGKDPELRRLAEKIIKDQEAEIAQLRSWLQRR